MQIKSAAFKDEEKIPYKYTCDGDDISPLIEIKDVPDEAESLAIIMDDPDAPGGVFDHWLVWNIPTNTGYIHENSLPDGAVMGKNSFGNSDYGGPCPPRGDGVHSYYFRLYALDTKLDLPEESSREELEDVMKDHIIEEVFTIGKYERS